MDDQAGYLIVLARIDDRARFMRYVQALPPVYAKFGGAYLAVGGPAQVHRYGAQGPAQSLVISRWQSLQQIQGFWSSPEYQAVKALRGGTGEFHVMACAGESCDAEMHALGLLLEPGVAFGDPGAESLLAADGLRTLASCEADEGVVLEGNRPAASVSLFGASSLAAAQAAGAALGDGPGSWWVSKRFGAA